MYNLQLNKNASHNESNVGEGHQLLWPYFVRFLIFNMSMLRPPSMICFVVGLSWCGFA